MLVVATLVTTVVGARAAEAGCPINVKFVNDAGTEVVVDARESKVKLNAGLWTKLLEDVGNVRVASGTSKTVAVNLESGCAADSRRFKIFVKAGSTSWWELAGPTFIDAGETVTITLHNE